MRIAGPSAAAVVAAGLLTAGPFAAPAAAHGGPVQVGAIVEELTLTPSDGRWVATVALATAETGDHLSNADVALAAGSGRPVQLDQTPTPGLYSGSLGKGATGTTTLALTVRSLPGGALVRPLAKSYPGVDLSGTSPVRVVGAAPEGGGGSAGGIAAAAGAGALVLGGLVLALRRRTAARWPVTPAAAS